jgi:VCBS repeat-containing protein
VNDGPLPQNDSATTLEAQPVTIAVLANDIDPDGDTLTVTAATANHGSVVVNADGTLTYRGDANFNGSDVIIYTASDGILTRTAAVLVTVAPVNNAPLPQNDSATLLEDSGDVIIRPLANDSDPDRDQLIVTSATANHGFVTVSPDGTRLAYSGHANYSGADVITYTVSDGTVTQTANVAVTITPVNDAPLLQFDSVTTLEDQPVTIAVLANDIDVDGDPLTIIQAGAERGTVTINADGTLTYVPRADYFGTDFAFYAVSDGTVTRFASVTIGIAPVHDAPILHDDTATVVEDHFVNIHVLDNDVFPDHEMPAVIGATAEHGTATVSAQGTVIYNSDADYNGADVITYTVFDGTVTRSATVAVTVLAENDAPSALALSHAALNEETPGAHVGVLSAVDPEGGVTFAVSDPRFEVVGNVLKLRDGLALDREQLPGGTLIMLATATDDGGLRTFADIHLVVNDVDEGTTISGFDAAGGDVLDFDAVMAGGMRNLFGWTGGTNPFGTEPGGGYLHLRQDGSDALLELDNNGGGDDFVPLVRFEDADIHDFTAANFFPGRDWPI